MNKVKANQLIQLLFVQQFAGHFDVLHNDEDSIVLTLLGSTHPQYHIELKIAFFESFVDFVYYLSPIIGMNQDESARFNMIQLLNDINWKVKSSGRFYLDDVDTVVYSLRISYAILETETEFVKKEIVAGSHFYQQYMEYFIDIANGEMTFDTAKLLSQLAYD